jgi:uncharacterized membrane protein YphA (DoxX/SURF4 family)
MAAMVSGSGALRALTLMLGIFFVFMGLDKAGWLMDSGALQAELRGWQASAPPLSRWYLETVAMPAVPLFARVVLLAELTTGVALLLGFRVRLVALVALLMVLNFHFASGIIFTSGYLTNGYGPPVIGGLLALAIGGARLPFSVSR